MPRSSRPSLPDPAVGLCSGCRHSTVQRSARGSAFWRCRAADDQPTLLRYPPLPVQRCSHFDDDAGPGEAGNATPR